MGGIRVLSIQTKLVHQLRQVADLISKKREIVFQIPRLVLHQGQVECLSGNFLSIHPDQPDFQFWPSRYTLS